MRWTPRQSARRDQLALERDLAAYSTEADITELEAILGRYDDTDEVIALRTIVQRSRTAA